MTSSTTQAAPASGGLRPMLGRVLAKGSLCALYLLFLRAHVAALADGFRFSIAVLAAFETVIVVMVFFRRDSTEVDLGGVAVAAALAGTLAPLALRPIDAGSDVLAGQLVQGIGVCLQLVSSLSLGRSFGLIPANRGIQTGGLYRLVRHPFYFSYLVTQIGYVINNPSAWNVAVLAAATALQVVRIRNEERLLLGDGDYRAYAEGVRWHLLPGVW